MSQPLHEPVPALRISALRWQGAPLPSEPPPPSFEFDPRGGNLGRDESCELLLPDPQRHVSRLQARIEFDRQGFWLVDLGSNPTQVDGQLLGRGQRLPLAGGEQLAIGDYELEVVALTRGTHSAQPLPSQRLSQSGQPRHWPATAVSVDDPFAVFAAAAKPLAQPASVLLTHPFAAPASRLAGSASVLPIEPAASDLLGMGLALESASIDELFGLRAVSGESSTGMVLSWQSREPAAGAMPASPACEPAEAAVPAQRQQPEPQPQFQAPSPEVGAAPPSPQEAPVDDPAAQWLAALQRGLGQPLNLPAGLTPALMELIGQLLREATQGTLDLLRDRALARRDLRAEHTLMASQHNNPLKFSPEAGFALAQMLGPRAPGFMAGPQALREAYADLLAHQQGLLAGTRQALSGLLGRFEPGALEARLGAHRLLDRLQPMARKARLWELLAQQYAELERAAEGDLQARFGPDFLAAYRQQSEARRQREPAAGGAARPEP